MARRAVLAVLVVQALLGCSDDSGDDAVDPLVFPADYAATYREVRDCRFSLEHDLVRVRVLAAPDALAAYTGRAAPFPAGAVVLKEQYAEDDLTCAGPIVSFTVMQKLAPGSAAATLDWTWQETGADRRTVATNPTRCIRCHTGCGKPPEGYDATCAIP